MIFGIVFVIPIPNLNWSGKMETSGFARKSAARIVLLASMCLLTNFALCALAQTTQKSAGDAATASTNGSKFTLGDSWIQVKSSSLSGQWNGLQILDRSSQRSIEIPNAFSLTLKNGSTLSSSSMKRTQPFVVHNLRSEPEASRYSDRIPGKEVCAEFNDSATAAEIEWCGIVRDGSNYFRQQITIHTGDQPLPITDVRILQFKDANAHVVGSVKGSPIADHTMFFGFEHPLSTSHVQAGEVSPRCRERCPCSRTKALSIPPSLALHHPGKCAATSSATSSANAPIPIAHRCITTPGMTWDITIAPMKPAHSIASTPSARS